MSELLGGKAECKTTLELGVLDSEGGDGHTQEEGYMVKVLNLDPLSGR